MTPKLRMLSPYLSLGLAATAVLTAGSPAQPILDAARKLYLAKDYPSATAAFQQAVELDPSNVAAWRELGRCHQLLGREQEALRVWDNLLRLDPTDTATLNAAGELQLARGEHQKASQLLGSSLQQNAIQPNIRIRLGEAFEGLADWEMAARQFDEALRTEPDRVDVILRRARIEEQLGQTAAAIARLEGTARRIPSAAEALKATLARLHGTQGDAAYRVGDYEAARQAMERGLQWEPGNAHLLTALGWALRRQGDTPKALETWTRAMAIPEAVTPNLVRAMAEARLDQNELTEARRLFEQARTLAPAEPSPCLQLLDIGLRQRDAELQETSLKALLGMPELDGEWADRASQLFIQQEQVERGLSLFSSVPSPHRGLALARLYAFQSSTAYGHDDLEEAIRLGRLALEQDPRNRQALRDLGWGYARKGDWPSCAATWSAYARSYPELAESHDLMAQALLFQQDYPGAIASEQKALALDPGLKSGRVRLLRAYALDGQLDRARELGKALSKEFPDDLVVHYRLAEVLSLAGDHAGAREVWGRVRQLDPDKPGPVRHWIQESYAMEDYEAALSEARRLAKTRPAPESALLFLAQDAELMGRNAEAASWYAHLTETHPAEASYWQQRIRQLELSDQLEAALRITEEALKQVPSSVDIRLAKAVLTFKAGRTEEALAQFQPLAKDHPGNLSAFQGLVSALMRVRRFDAALDHLQGPGFRQNFLSDFERDLWRAEALNGIHRYREAESLLTAVAQPQDGRRYLPILLYHGIEDQERTASISAERFDSQMTALAKAGYTAILLTELAQLIDGRMPWPKRPILISFDDGRTDSFVKADPVLARLGLKATMFLRTGDIAPTADTYLASWRTVLHYAGTDRWELQTHSYRSHDPIPVDAEGRQGKFLIDRAWISELQRPETDQEFQARLDGDYRRGRETLLEKVPKAQPLAYAFPYNEAGQLSVSDLNQAASFNEAAWTRYFRFGMVQDGNGFNVIRPGEQGQRLLWRYEPLRTWSGDELLAHLACKDPANEARLRIAQLWLWRGFPQRARRQLSALEQEVPAMHASVERALAEIAWAEGRPREAAAHLADYQAAQPPKVAAELQKSLLAKHLDWANDPHAGIGADIHDSSDDRSRKREFLTFTVPFRIPLDFEVRAGAIQYAEKDLDLKGEEIEGRASWAPTSRFDASLWGGRRTFESLAARQRAGLDLHYGFETQDLRLGVQRDDLDTLASLRAGVRRWSGTLDYALRYGQWSFFVDGSRTWTTDHNRMQTLLAKAMYQPEQAPRWQFGMDLQQGDSCFHSGLYYTPMDYRAARLRARCALPLQDGSTFNLDLAGGRSDDDVNGGRWTGSATLDWVEYWNQRLRTTLSLGAGSSTGQSSRHAGLTVEVRF